MECSLPRFSGGIKSSIFCIKSANSSRKLYNEDLLLWNCNELLRISDPRWVSEWFQSITTSRHDRSSVLDYYFSLYWNVFMFQKWSDRQQRHLQLSQATSPFYKLYFWTYDLILRTRICHSDLFFDCLRVLKYMWLPSRPYYF